MSARSRTLLAASVVALATQAQSRDGLDAVVEEVTRHEADAVALASDLWDFAELGYLEERSARRLSGYLDAHGFAVDRGVAGIPTAFVATWGQGGPTLGILAEFDALPGLSQAALPKRRPVTADAPGHACGHNLFGAASVVAVVAVARWLEATGRDGTIRLYGTPAEEGGSGKVYLTREGLFEGVDAVLHWHPSDRNDASPSSSTANKSGRFRFEGAAAHAAAAPDKGRSALDGVEAMNYMVNLMREHMPSDARIHYVITDGGDAPNIVPETAEVYYYVRHPRAERAVALFERVVAAAAGAARGTETRMSYEVMHGNYPVLPNDALAEVIHANLRALGGVAYSADERVFAETIRSTLLSPRLGLGSEGEIQRFEFRQGMGSTDVGDVSWNVPTGGFRTATWVPGTPAHSWQAVAAGGMSIGHKGMMLAAKVLAVTATDLFEAPEVLAAAREELERRRGDDFVYAALLGDREPPLDYRR